MLLSSSGYNLDNEVYKMYLPEDESKLNNRLTLDRLTDRKPKLIKLTDFIIEYVKKYDYD